MSPTQLFQSQAKRLIIEQNASGSTFKEISGGTLQAIHIPLPPTDLVESYTQTVTPFSTQQQNTQQQNTQLQTQELTRLRDWLLPMLMNGQVMVSA